MIASRLASGSEVATGQLDNIARGDIDDKFAGLDDGAPWSQPDDVVLIDEFGDQSGGKPGDHDARTFIAIDGRRHHNGGTQPVLLGRCVA